MSGLPRVLYLALICAGFTLAAWLLLSEFILPFISGWDRFGASLLWVLNWFRLKSALLGAFACSPTQLRVLISPRAKPSGHPSMMYKQIAFEIIMAVALGLVISIGAVYLIDICFGPIDEAEANYTVSGGRWSPANCFALGEAKEKLGFFHSPPDSMLLFELIEPWNAYKGHAHDASQMQGVRDRD
jgi:hypothetical protein